MQSMGFGRALLRKGAGTRVVKKFATVGIVAILGVERGDVSYAPRLKAFY